MSIKAKISRNFSRAASRYNDSAHLQKDIACQLVKLAKPCISADSHLLDLGSGTGFVAKELGRKIMQADIAFGMCKHATSHSPAICADMESLPFRSDFFDVILSASSIQWADIRLAFSEVSRILKKDGYFIFSTFSEGTLSDIRSSFRKAGINSVLNEFLSEAAVKQHIAVSSLELVSFSSEERKFEFDSISEFLWSIKDIGAGAAERNDDTLNRKKLTEVEDIYKNDFNSDRITANWFVNYYICRRSS